jgi:hypothetical protein
MVAMWGTFLIPIALFYQAWTTYPTLPPWPCLSAGVLFGMGILSVFISSYMYIIDVYAVSKEEKAAKQLAHRLTFVHCLLLYRPALPLLLAL